MSKFILVSDNEIVKDFAQNKRKFSINRSGESIEENTKLFGNQRKNVV